MLIEWPRGDAEPTKYWLSTLPATTPVADLVRLAKLRWRIERDDQELKDELGLDQRPRATAAPRSVASAWGGLGGAIPSSAQGSVGETGADYWSFAHCEKGSVV